MVISLGPSRDRPRRRLRGGSRLSASASNLQTAGSEIAAGRIALFTPVGCPPALVSVALTRLPACQSGLSAPESTAPAFTGHPRSMQLGLSSNPRKGQRPSSLPHPLLLTYAPARLVAREFRVDRAYCALRAMPRSVARVPKGRFELPRAIAHYALNVARLPIPPLRRGASSSASVEPTVGLEPTTCCLRNSCSTN